MQMLFERARKFIYRNARPLDFARWKYHFEDGTADDIIRILAAYQNSDGGFGHGLEADSLNPCSTPIQTWYAVMNLRAIGLYNADHPMVKGIVRYLESGDAFDGHCWAWAIPSNNDYPHAPWWSYQEPEEDGIRNYNPTASLVGWLLRVTGSDFAMGLAREAVDFYLSSMQLQDMQHTLPCFLDLYRDILSSAPEAFETASLEACLRRDITECVCRAAKDWGGYCAMPSDYILGMDDPFLSCAPELAKQECEFLARTQQENGAWSVPWGWGAYPDDFAVSANRWQSYGILKNLLYLRGMGVLR